MSKTRSKRLYRAHGRSRTEWDRLVHCWQIQVYSTITDGRSGDSVSLSLPPRLPAVYKSIRLGPASSMGAL